MLAFNLSIQQIFELFFKLSNDIQFQSTHHRTLGELSTINIHQKYSSRIFRRKLFARVMFFTKFIRGARSAQKNVKNLISTSSVTTSKLPK